MKLNLKTFNIFFLVFYALFTISVFSFAQTVGVSVSLPILEEPYGGERLATIECNCSNGIHYLIIDEYATGRIMKLLYVEGVSKIYDWNMPTTAKYLLGSYKRQDQYQCRIDAEEGCAVLPDDGTLGSAPGSGTSE